MKKKRRIFLAIPISKTLQNDIFLWQAAHAHLPVRWIAPENLHITLVPPWYTADIDKTIGMLQKMSGATAFAGTLTQISLGPDPGRPRLVWVTGETPQELPTLKKRLEKVLRHKSEHRPFLFHLTLGRFRTIPSSPTAIQTVQSDVSWKETFSSFALMESHLSRRGARYTTIAAFPFQ